MDRFEIRPPNVAVIGTGRVGERHARALHRLGVPLSLYDINIVTSLALARSLGINAFAYESLDLALNTSQLTYVCTPFVDHLHMAPIRLATQQGKPIFCEKPISDNLEDAYKIQEMVNQSGVPFVVGNYHLLNRPIEELLRHFHEGEIGWATELNLSYIHDMTLLFAGSWRNKNNYLYDAGVHPVDLALLMAGEKDSVSTVSARTDFATQEGDYYLRLGFKSGMPARIRLTYRPQESAQIANSGVGVQIVGTEGMLEATSLGSTLTLTKKGHDQVLEVSQGIFPLPVNRVAAAMLSIIAGNARNYYPLPGIDRSLKGIQVLAAADESLKKGGSVIKLV